MIGNTSLAKLTIVSTTGCKVGEPSAVGADVSVEAGAFVAASVACGEDTTGAAAAVGWEAGDGVVGLAHAVNTPTSKSKTKTFTILETIFRSLLKPV